MRGIGGFVRATWDEVNEIIAAANAYTVKTYGPDRVFGFSPIPAMSMVSYAAGARYLSLIGGVCMSFYDWYCDLPPAIPQTWGEQTDVPESADWYNSGFLILWGSNVPQTRTPDAHFYTEARYKGAKRVVVCPDYSEASKFADLWLSPKQGTDSALAMAIGHVILQANSTSTGRPSISAITARQYTDMPMLVRLVKRGDALCARALRARLRFRHGARRDQQSRMEDRRLSMRPAARSSCRNGSVGFRWGEKGKWNLEEKGQAATTPNCALSLTDISGRHRRGRLSLFRQPRARSFPGTDHPDVLTRNVPVKTLQLTDGETLVASVYDLFVANYGVDRGLGGEHLGKSYDDVEPYTPAWAEKITGVPRDQIITVAREFALNAEKTDGRSMVIVGAGLNHWYHMDMNYRGIINMLVMCGCVGQSGGGWSHYVGQEKLRPQTGWTPLAFALDWGRPPRQMNSTSAFYAHTDQWRYETLDINEILSPTAPVWPVGGALIDYNVARRADGLVAVRAATAKQSARGVQTCGGCRAGAEGLCRQGPEVGRAAIVVRRSGQSQELAAQSVRLALQPSGRVRQGPRIFPQASARHQTRRDGQGPRASTAKRSRSK